MVKLALDHIAHADDTIRLPVASKLKADKEVASGGGALLF